MRALLLLCLLLAGCTRPSVGIDWDSWTRTAVLAGKMRTERSARDAPVTRASLVGNFRSIAFDPERHPFGRDRPAGPQPAEPHLRKWTAPIRYRLITLDGDRTPMRARIDPFMKRLASITGHPITRESSNPTRGQKANLMIVHGPDQAFAVVPDMLRARGKLAESHAATAAATDTIADFITAWRTARSPCAGTIYEAKGTGDGAAPKGTIVAGVVVIRSELPDALLQGCVEEELSQIMGLLNDDPAVRPSIFNDDQEFALLTRHDELLLRILYDRRLAPGMTPAVAMPIVERIIAELLPGA